MTVAEYIRLVAQIAVLKEVAMEYPTRTIDNIIVQTEARKKEILEYRLSKKETKETKRT